MHCQLDARLAGFASKVDLPATSLPGLSLQKSSVYSGESLSLDALFSGEDYKQYTISSADGYYDAGTNTLIVPKNLHSKTIQLTFTDAQGNSAQVPVQVRGLDESFEVVTPQSFGDQNYPEAGVRLADGTLLVGTIIVDSAGGWEWVVIHRSTDNGATWNVTDYYAPYDNGETHILSMANHGNKVYACGYQWDSDNYDAIHWWVRKSSDSGVTWATVDAETTNGLNSVCNTIAVSAATGYVYAGGYDTAGTAGAQRWVLKESRDEGQTWNIIFSMDADNYNGGIKMVEVAPDGTVWMIGANASNMAILYKGVFSGSWSFTDMSVNFGIANSINYQTYGEMEVTDNNTAYLSSNFGGTWTVRKTTDGGATWSVLYNPGANTEGGEIQILNDGTVLAIGSYATGGFSAPKDVRLLKSVDGGATWTATVLKSESHADGCLLLGHGPSVHAISNTYDFARHFYSGDSGGTWSEGEVLVYTERFYNNISKLLVLPSGKYLTVGFVNYMDKTQLYQPWYVGLSSDQGATWTQPGTFVQPGYNWDTYDAAYDSLGNIYVLGGEWKNKAARIRKSTDQGATWSDSEFYTQPTYPSDPFSGENSPKLAVDKDDNVYYGAYYWDTSVSKGKLELRKSTAGGSSWSTVKIFPENSTYASFGIRDLKVDAANNLWLASRERNSSGTYERALYKSADGGVNWVEVLREADPSYNPFVKITFDSTGAIYLLRIGLLQKSTDGGATWTTLMDASYSPEDILVTSSSEVFVLAGGMKIFKLQGDGSWLLINDQSDKVDPSGRKYLYNYGTVALYELSPTKLGLHVSFSEFSKGSVDLFKTLQTGN